MRILDDYGVDGVYNDLGYVPAGRQARPAQATRCSPSRKRRSTTAPWTISGADLRRGQAPRRHRQGPLRRRRAAADRPEGLRLPVGGRRGQDGDRLREATKNHPPYVVPCLDMSRAKIDREDELYLHAIPYMQFPLLLAGRPFTGQRAAIPGIEYPPEEKCFWTRHCRRDLEALPGPSRRAAQLRLVGLGSRPARGPAHPRAMAERYLPLVEEGTWAWLEIGDCDLFAGRCPPAWSPRRSPTGTCTWCWPTSARRRSRSTRRPLTRRWSMGRLSPRVTGSSKAATLQILVKA